MENNMLRLTRVSGIELKGACWLWRAHTSLMPALLSPYTTTSSTSTGELESCVENLDFRTILSPSLSSMQRTVNQRAAPDMMLWCAMVSLPV